MRIRESFRHTQKKEGSDEDQYNNSELDEEVEGGEVCREMEY